MSKKETERNKEIVWMCQYPPRLSCVDVGRIFSISRQRVHKILKDAGVLNKKG